MTGQSGRDGHYKTTMSRAGMAGHLGQDNHDKVAGMGLPRQKQSWQDSHRRTTRIVGRTARTQPPGKDRHDGKGPVGNN
jgi:hypothetical protein